MRKILLPLAALAALAACTAESGPAPTTATVGQGSPPLRQQSFQQPHSNDASAGAATISGGDTQGRPQVTRDGSTAGPGIGGVPPQQRTPAARNTNKGGG
jgi:hypothetical protein